MRMMSSEQTNVLIGPSVVVRVTLKSQASIMYRFVGQFAGEPYTYVCGGDNAGDLQVAGMTSDTIALVTHFPKGEWAGYEVEGPAEMLADD